MPTAEIVSLIGAFRSHKMPALFDAGVAKDYYGGALCHLAALTGSH
jgi:hypothetical protein